MGEGWMGEWTTSYGSRMIFKPEAGSNVIGRYDSDGGRIVGNVVGNSLNGYWVEIGSKHDCKSKKDGSQHWGKFIITFNDNFTTYSGYWTYCDNGKKENKWEGKKLGPIK